MDQHMDDPFCHKLHQVLGRERFSHSCGVATVARDLAGIWGADPEKASLAGLLHDYARPLTGRQLLEMADEYGLPVDDVERCIPVLLHGRVAAERVQADRLCRDPEILEAIRQHVTAGPAMSCLGKLIFVADMIEPGRAYPGVEHLRHLAATDPEAALRHGIKSKIAYLLNRNWVVHPRIIAAYNRFAAGADGTDGPG